MTVQAPFQAREQITQLFLGKFLKYQDVGLNLTHGLEVIGDGTG
jgi:hypothetical protein